MAKRGQIHTRFNAHSKGTLSPIHKGYIIDGPGSLPAGSLDMAHRNATWDCTRSRARMTVRGGGLARLAVAHPMAGHGGLVRFLNNPPPPRIVPMPAGTAPVR